MIVSFVNAKKLPQELVLIGKASSPPGPYGIQNKLTGILNLTICRIRRAWVREIRNWIRSCTLHCSLSWTSCWRAWACFNHVMRKLGLQSRSRPTLPHLCCKPWQVPYAVRSSFVSLPYFQLISLFYLFQKPSGPSKCRQLEASHGAALEVPPHQRITTRTMRSEVPTDKGIAGVRHRQQRSMRAPHLKEEIELLLILETCSKMPVKRPKSVERCPV